MLHLSIQLSEIAFLGAPVEYDPVIWVEGTWAGARFGRFTPVFAGAGATHELDIPLPSDGSAQAGDMLWLSLLAHTQCSGGLAEIDEKEGKYRVTYQESGELCVPLADLLGSAGKELAAVPFSDHMLRDVIDRKLRLAAVADRPESQQHLVFADPAAALGQERANKIAEQVFYLSSKGAVTLSATHHHRGQMPRTQTVPRRRKQAPRIVRYPSKPGDDTYAEALMGMNARLEEQYVLYSTALSLPPLKEGGPMRKGLFGHARDDPLMEYLHLARFRTRAGPLPVPAYLLQDLQWRSRAIADAELRDMSAENERAYLDSLQRRILSSLLARGMSGSDFAEVVRAQHKRTDHELDPRYVTAVSAVLHTAELAVTRVKYKADAHIPNMAWMTANMTEAEQRTIMPAEYFGESSKKVEGMAARVRAMNGGTSTTTTSTIPAPPLSRMSAVSAQLAHHAMMGRQYNQRHLRRGFSAPLSESATTSAQRVLSQAYIADDDWDFGVSSGKMDADDCEGVAAATVVILERQRDILNTATQALTPELDAMKIILNTFEPLFAGGTVSEPYVKDEGKAPAGAAAAGPPPHPPMPIKGSPEALKWKSGGHGFGHFWPQALRAKLQLNALDRYPDSSLAPEDYKRIRALLQRQVDAAPPWLMNSISLRMMIEGTGQVNPNILPAAETFAANPTFAAKTCARIDFVRALKAKGFYREASTGETPTHAGEMTILAECLRPESQPYEKAARSDPLQWPSPFYRGTAGIVSLRAYLEESPVLAACSAIDMRANVRGVDTATMLTTCAEHVAFHPQYGAGISEREWRAEISPVMEAALEQCSVSNYLREIEQVPGAQHVASPLSATALTQLAAATPTYLQTALNGLVEASESRELSALGEIECASRSDKQEVLALTLDTQSLPALGEAKATQLLAALDTLQKDGKILRYALVRDQPLMHCSSCLQVLLLLPVA